MVERFREDSGKDGAGIQGREIWQYRREAVVDQQIRSVARALHLFTLSDAIVQVRLK